MRVFVAEREREIVAVPASVVARARVSVRAQHRNSIPLAEPVTAGGVLWRRGAGDAEICLVRDVDGSLRVPRGVVHEDERLSEAAARAVLLATGFAGRSRAVLGRLVGPGEIAHLFLIELTRAARSMFGSAEEIEWVPAAKAAARIPNEAERQLVQAAAEALTEP